MAQNGEGATVIKGEDLVYKDDNFDTYFTVFDTAKTDIEDNDKVYSCYIGENKIIIFFAVNLKIMSAKCRQKAKNIPLSSNQR